MTTIDTDSERTHACEIVWGEKLSRDIDEMIERTTGTPCPGTRGGACFVLPRGLNEAFTTATTTPAWATSTIEPEDGSHEGEVTAGPVTLKLGQNIPFAGGPEPIYVWLPEADQLVGAQACRDLAAALLEAARVIDAAAL